MTKAVVELNCAQVGKEQDIRGDFAGDGVCGDLLRVFQGGALAAHAHRHIAFLGSFCQALVDLPGLLGSSGHG